VGDLFLCFVMIWGHFFLLDTFHFWGCFQGQFRA